MVITLVMRRVAVIIATEELDRARQPDTDSLIYQLQNAPQGPVQFAAPLLIWTVRIVRYVLEGVGHGVKPLKCRLPP
jgi:hypothetical protein